MKGKKAKKKKTRNKHCVGLQTIIWFHFDTEKEDSKKVLQKYTNTIKEKEKKEQIETIFEYNGGYIERHKSTHIHTHTIPKL